ncbi:MAG: 4-(cytidine 5'-diphospho)-2-C-methyl-D-erythritol kinase [Nitrospirota bacterium]
MKLSLNAPAKINWFLSVLDKRDDGYHNILSAMQGVDLFDRLYFEDDEKIALISDLDVRAEENLVFKAAVMLKRYSSYPGGARIILEKEIPVAAGLGGGSSDAAYTLIGLNRLWGLNLKNAELAKMASEIGSDVPFFIGGPFSIVSGKGEKVEDIEMKSSAAVLLVKPDISISAAWAYNSFKTTLTKKSVDIKLFCLTLENRDFASLRQMIFNDLERAVVGKYQTVAEIKKMLRENGAVISSMSGSGPTVFGVFNSVEEAVRASVNMGDNWCRVVRTLRSNDKLQTGNSE